MKIIESWTHEEWHNTNNVSYEECADCKNKILKNGLTGMGNLIRCIIEETATAETFERAIEQEGLNMEIIALISEYYHRDLKNTFELKKAKEIVFKGVKE